MIVPVTIVGMSVQLNMGCMGCALSIYGAKLTHGQHGELYRSNVHMEHLKHDTT